MVLGNISRWLPINWFFFFLLVEYFYANPSGTTIILFISCMDNIWRGSEQPFLFLSSADFCASDFYGMRYTF